MNLKIVETGDGLHSLYVPELDEHYHSTHGALQEALHVFINAGFNYKMEQGHASLSILEIGFGTGLNAYLSWLAAERQNVKVDYCGLELYPVPADLAARLNYVETIGGTAKAEEYNRMHEVGWNQTIELSSNFSLEKVDKSVFEFESPARFDLIYFDAFGFRAQEEMWSAEVFQKMFDVLKPGGTLVTYSSKGEVRRRMQAAGFSIEKLAGPAGKREMVRATKAM